MFQDDEKSNYMVMFLRFITSANLQANSELYSCYVDEGLTIDLFCRTQVEPLDVDADNVLSSDLAANYGALQLHGHSDKDSLFR